MKQLLVSQCVAIAGLALLGSGATAAPILLSPDADTQINSGSKTTNYGGSASLAIRGNSMLRTYIRFDLSSLNAEVEAASLTVTFTAFHGASQSYRLYALADGNSNGENWIEGNGGTDNNPANEITWNNAPGNDPNSTAHNSTNPNPIAPAVFLQAVAANPSASNPTLTFSNIAITNLLNADTNNLVTFIIGRTDGASSSIPTVASKENATASARPVLSVTLVPEPASLTLAGLAGVGLLRRRRVA